jgi:hypothetical protein
VRKVTLETGNLKLETGDLRVGGMERKGERYRVQDTASEGLVKEIRLQVEVNGSEQDSWG